MTEKEAHEKWCPFARVITPTDEGYSPPANRIKVAYSGPVEGSHCIASNCMMWKWESSRRIEGRCGLAV